MDRTDTERLESWRLALILAGDTPEEAEEKIVAIAAEEAKAATEIQLVCPGP